MINFINFYNYYHYSMDNTHRYQLIAPVHGDKIYQTTSLNKGAKKCFEELKGCGKNNFNSFTVMNLDNYETYKFAIGGRHLQHGGGDESGNINSNLVHDSNVVQQQVHQIKLDGSVYIEQLKSMYDEKIKKLEKAIVVLNDKIVALEAKTSKNVETEQKSIPELTKELGKDHKNEDIKIDKPSVIESKVKDNENKNIETF